MSLVVGLTGGIGSGKTVVAELFAEQGVPVIDTDAIAHELTVAGGAAMPAIVDAFGPEVLRADGGLDRDAMRRRAFSDTSVKKTLESILHPLIRGESDARCRAASDAPYVMLVVPLLVESMAYRERVGRVLVIDCDEAVQVARVVARNGLSPSEVRAIMATQASRAQRLSVADDVIVNAGPLEALRDQLASLHARYVALSKKRHSVIT